MPSPGSHCCLWFGFLINGMYTVKQDYKDSTFLDLTSDFCITFGNVLIKINYLCLSKMLVSMFRNIGKCVLKLIQSTHTIVTNNTIRVLTTPLQKCVHLLKLIYCSTVFWPSALSHCLELWINSVVLTTKICSGLIFHSSHAALMYGRFRSKPSAEEDRAMKMAKLNKMKKIYLPPRISPSKVMVVITLSWEGETCGLLSVDYQAPSMKVCTRPY